MTAPVPEIPEDDETWSCPFGNDHCLEDDRCRECCEEEAAERQADWIREEGW